jgi:VanZ family protein
LPGHFCLPALIVGNVVARYRKLRIACFWGALLFTYGSAMVPGDMAPSLGSTDKIDHMTAFLTLSLLARLAYPRQRLWVTGVALSFFGAFIEFSQAIPFFHRDADVMDWVADTAAVIIGLAATHILEVLAPKAFVD